MECLGLFRIVGRLFELMSFNRVYKTRVSTHAGARYLEIAASKSEDAGREDNFQYKKYADVLRTFSYLTLCSGCSHLASLIGGYSPEGGYV